jgi:hypothetical protein
MDGSAEFEVFCPRCGVTFPIGTKKCLHCGGRTAPGHGRPAPPLYSTLDSLDAQETAVDGGSTARPSEGLTPPPRLEELEHEGEESAPRPGIMRIGSGLMWVILAIGFSLMRMCQEG